MIAGQRVRGGAVTESPQVQHRLPEAAQRPAAARGAAPVAPGEQVLGRVLRLAPADRLPPRGAIDPGPRRRRYPRSIRAQPGRRMAISRRPSAAAQCSIWMPRTGPAPWTDGRRSSLTRRPLPAASGTRRTRCPRPVRRPPSVAPRPARPTSLKSVRYGSAEISADQEPGPEQATADDQAVGLVQPRQGPSPVQFIPGQRPDRGLTPQRKP